MSGQTAWIDIPEWTLPVTAAIMESVKAKDPETYAHCVRVSRGARFLAKVAGLNELDQKLVEFAGLFHDVGKIGVPDAILHKPAKLTPDEMQKMMDHPEISVRILKPLEGVEFFSRLMPGVLYHHERFDGLGYPHKISGEEIPLASRIILIADTYDAMTADRAYRKGRAPEVAYKELEDYAGRQFDPRLVKLFNEAHPRWFSAHDPVFEEMNQRVLKIPA